MKFEKNRFSLNVEENPQIKKIIKEITDEAFLFHRKYSLLNNKEKNEFLKEHSTAFANQYIFAIYPEKIDGFVVVEFAPKNYINRNQGTPIYQFDTFIPELQNIFLFPQTWKIKSHNQNGTCSILNEVDNYNCFNSLIQSGFIWDLNLQKDIEEKQNNTLLKEIKQWIGILKENKTYQKLGKIK